MFSGRVLLANKEKLSCSKAGDHCEGEGVNAGTFYEEVLFRAGQAATSAGIVGHSLVNLASSRRNITTVTYDELA